MRDYLSQLGESIVYYIEQLIAKHKRAKAKRKLIDKMYFSPKR